MERYLINVMYFQKQIQELVGNKTLSVIKIIEDGDYHPVYEIEKKLKIDASEIRSILYDLDKFNFVESKKIRDKIKNYSVVYWRIKKKNVKNYFNKNNGKIELPAIIKEFYCKRCKSEFDINESLEENYHCRECGEILWQK